MILTDRIICRLLPYLISVSDSDDGITYLDLHKQVNPNSIDLTIGSKWLRPVEVSEPVYFGFTSKEDSMTYQKRCWQECRSDSWIEMRPGESILAYSREYITMPNDVCGQLYEKSSLGRFLINHMMAGVVDAGFHGKLTYELKNDGVHTVRIPVGARIVQLVLSSLEEPPEIPYGQRISRYQYAQTVECAKWSPLR